MKLFLKAATILLVHLLSANVLAAQLPIPAQEFPSILNRLVNPGFENGKYAWTASSGVVAVNTSASDGAGSYGYSWNSDGTAQTLLSNAVTIPEGLKTKPGLAFCAFKVPSGTATHTITVNDGTNDLVTAQTVINSSSQFVRMPISFIYPSSGSVKIKIASVASNEPEIYIDSCYLGEASIVLAPRQDLFSAKVSSADAVSTENIDWIDGNCTDATTGEATCTFKSGIFSEAPSCQVTGTTADTNGTVTSISASALTVLMETTSTGADADAAFHVVCQKSGADALQEAYRPELLNWRVDANISGGNPDLGTSDQASYTGIASAGLSLTNNTGNGVITAQIPCSTTNPPTGTTCAVGDESVGVSFNLPIAGDVLACVSFTHNFTLGSSGNVNSTFQIVETPVSAQTISQEGKARVNSGATGATASWQHPFRVCGQLSFSSAGQKVIRLFYEQDITATVTTNQIIGDASAVSGQRDIHWEVYPINQKAAPIVVVNPRVTFIKDVKAAGTDGGTCTAGSYLTRTLNTQTGDSSFATLASNQITLTAGQYHIEGYAPASQLNKHKAIFYNVTDAATAIIGSAEHVNSSGGSGNSYSTSHSRIDDVVTITSSKVFEVRHQCETTATTYGFGEASAGFGDSEVYTTVKITKIY